MLSTEQIQSFKRDGYVVVRDLIEESILENWRGQISETYGSLESPPNQEAARESGRSREHITVLTGFRFDPDTRFANHPGVRAIVDQLGDGQFTGDDGNIRLLWPDPQREWDFPDSGHIDGYFGKRRTFPFVLGIVTYLFDVEPHGGGTAFWPGSHVKTWEFYQEFPDHMELSPRLHPSFQESMSHIQPVELFANAGDVIFWHSNICHETTLNTSNRIRYGLFARMPNRDQESIKDDVPENFWKHWGI